MRAARMLRPLRPLQGYVLLLAAVTQSDNPANPHGLAQGWAYLARWVANWLGWAGLSACTCMHRCVQSPPLCVLGGCMGGRAGLPLCSVHLGPCKHMQLALASGRMRPGRSNDKLCAPRASLRGTSVLPALPPPFRAGC